MKLLVSEQEFNRLTSISPGSAFINGVEHPLPIALDQRAVLTLDYGFWEFSLAKLQSAVDSLLNRQVKKSALDFLSIDGAQLNSPFEVILIGCGESQRFPDRELMKLVVSGKIPLEFMITEAAARTFNILSSENRRVLALLFSE